MSNKNIVVFAPHADDEVLGVGGTIARRISEGYRAITCIATQSNDYAIRQKETLKANEFLKVSKVINLGFNDLSLDMVDHDVLTSSIRDVLKEYRPVEVYMPHPGDLHTDHKALSASVLVAVRPKYDFAPKYVFTYETMSETGWDYLDPNNSFNPNVYVDISKYIKQKLAALSMYESQVSNDECCRSLNIVNCQSSFRGAQCGMNKAEAFTLVRCYIREGDCL